MDFILKNFNNEVYHCGPTRTGTTVIYTVFKDVIKFIGLDIESIHTGHKNIGGDSTLGKIITVRNPLHIASSMKRVHYPAYEPGFDNPMGSPSLCREVWNIANYTKSVIDNINCKFICVVKYEDYLPNNIEQLVFDYVSLLYRLSLSQTAERMALGKEDAGNFNFIDSEVLQFWASMEDNRKGIYDARDGKLIYKAFILAESWGFKNKLPLGDDLWRGVSLRKLSTFARVTAKKYSIENQKKIIKEANLEKYSDIEESHGLHGNHITSGDGVGKFDNLSDHEIDKILLDNYWYINHFGYTGEVLDVRSEEISNSSSKSTISKD